MSEGRNLINSMSIKKNVEEKQLEIDAFIRNIEFIKSIEKELNIKLSEEIAYFEKKLTNKDNLRFGLIDVPELNKYIEALKKEVQLEKNARQNKVHPNENTNDRLNQNLIIGKKAASYASNLLVSTNQESAYDFEKNHRLETIREQMNNVELVKFYSKLKNQCKKNDSPPFDDLTTYRKGVGINMRLWSLYAVSKNKEKLGNCTELNNAAFGFIYQNVYESFRENNTSTSSAIRRVIRVDVDNNEGGHSFLLIDPNPTLFVANKTYSIDAFFDQLDQLGDACVVVDAWNKKHPAYHVSESLSKMPPCARTGTFNIEFGLGFTADEGKDSRSNYSYSI